MITSGVVVTVSYIVVLVALGFVAGFSPLLYAMAARFSALEQRDRLITGVALVAGVATGIVLLLSVGGGMALGIQYLRDRLGYGGDLHYVGAAILGLALLVYQLLRSRRSREISHLSGAPGKNGSSYSRAGLASLYLVACVKTVVSLSGVAATTIVATGLASRDVSVTMAVLVVLPLMLFAATAPFVVIVASRHLSPGLYNVARNAIAMIDGRIQSVQRRAVWFIVVLALILIAYSIVGFLRT